MIFFRNLSGKLLRVWWIFPGDLSKGNLWLQRSFRGKDKIWDKFRQFRQKFLARVSIMLFNCPLEPLKKNIPQKIYILSVLNEHQTFQFFGETFFRQGCQSCNLCVRRRFLKKWFFLRKLFVCKTFCRVWAEEI